MHATFINGTTSIRFTDPDLASTLAALVSDELDALDFGVIGFDASTMVVAYNAYESTAAGLRRQSVVGRPLFLEVAPCMNNYLVAQRFEDALTSGKRLDVVVDYVLTLRMRPVKVALRLIASPASSVRYVLVDRHG